MTMLILLLACQHVASSENGAEIYDNTCAGCHGSDGASGVQIDGVPAADLADVVPEYDDDGLATVINEGQGAMPAQGLDEDDTADVIAFLRETFGG